MKVLLYTAVLVFLLSSCADKQSPGIIELDPLAGIDLKNIEVGDQARYALYESGCDGGFFFTGDTLVVTVEEENDTTLLHETFTEGSNLELSSRHPIIQKDGYLLVPRRFESLFLFFYGNDTIFLDREPEIALEQSGCKLYHGEQEFVGDFIGSVNSFHFGSILLQDTKGVSCVPSFMGLDAYILYQDYLNWVHIVRAPAGEEQVFGFIAIQ